MRGFDRRSATGESLFEVWNVDIAQSEISYAAWEAVEKTLATSTNAEFFGVVRCLFLNFPSFC